MSVAVAAVKRAQKQRLLGMLMEDGKEIPVIGYMCWWSIRNVNLNRTKFIEFLKECGLDESYAREHNYRSAFKRALNSLEEQRIIRLVDEDGFRIRYQFTAEKLTNTGGQTQLDYNRETIIEVDKQIYQQTKKFENALTQGKKEIRDALVKLFYQEKTSYKSSDISRYIQRIFEDKADIVSLRQQGCLYFIPAGFRDILDKVANLVRLITQEARSFEYVPLPDVKSSRSMVGNAVKDEAQESYELLAAEIETAMKSSQEVTEVWKRTRVTRLKKLQERLSRYESVLGDNGKILTKETVSLEQEIMKFRKLDLD